MILAHIGPLPVEELLALAPALRAARESGGPAVIEVLTDPDDTGPRPT